MKHKFEFEIGGQVKISDRWYEIVSVDPDATCVLPIAVELSSTLNWVSDEFVTDYEKPPEPKEEEVYISTIRMNADGAYVTLSNGFSVSFTAQDLINLESFRKL